MAGDADIASTAALLGDRARARIVAALGDGRALAASVLACEAGVAASTASEHLARLVNGGLLTVERHGRHRYFRLAGPDVARMLEAMARVSPPARVTSLRDGTRANALRTARTCYDHLAGRVGTGLMAAMISGDLIRGGDGVFDPSSARRDRLSSRGHDVTYELTADGRRVLHSLGVALATSSRRPYVGYCVDWSEQRHHLSGAVGAALLDRMLDLAWIIRQPSGRAVWLSQRGQSGLEAHFGFAVDPGWVHRPTRARGAA
ncbi:MAG TPA: winged helix-turn-helix domain-containing protein [Gaiellales bacterium]|jgi:DNA-binding transcriptional ArsR family regulator